MTAILAVVAAETRSALRTVRLRTFACLVAVFVAVVFGFHGHLPTGDTGPFLPLAYHTPRFLIWQFGSYLLVLSLAGVAALGFDAARRDAREGMADAIGSRPPSNAVLLGGRLVGLSFTVWLVVAATLALLQLSGVLAELSGSWSAAVEGVSLAAFLAVDLAPALVLWGAVVLLLASALRNRAVVALAALALLALAIWAAYAVPVHLHRALFPISDHAGFASDLAPRFTDPRTLLQRGSMLVLAAGLLAVAAAADGRPDDAGPGRLSAWGAALATTGGLGLFLAVAWAAADLALRGDWRAAHEAVDARAGFRLERLDGRVAIDPGRELSIDVELLLSATAGKSTLRFGFNPGMRVRSLRIDGLASYRHERGLLSVELAAPMAPGSARALAVTATGVPDPRFAYLDGVLDPLRARSGRRLWRLGTEASLFGPDYVALMPGVRWLPTPGPGLDGGGPPPDRFEVDLAVDVPPGWLVAGPGRRRGPDAAAGGGDPGRGATRFRFRPGAPVSGVALFASAFDRRRIETGGVVFEFLAHPGHMEHWARLAGSGDELAGLIGEYVADSDAAGLSYPYDGLTVVEVPARLRSYGGDRTLGTAFALPGILPVRETLSTLHPDGRLALLTRASGGSVALGRRRLLLEFARSDHHGVDLHGGFSRNLFGHVAGAEGGGSEAVDFLLRELTSALFMPPGTAAGLLPFDMFTAHTFDVDAPIGTLVGEMVRVRQEGRGVSRIFSPTWLRMNSPAAWETAERHAPPRPGMGARDAGLATIAMALRAGKAAGLVLDTLGWDGSARLLSDLRSRFEGGAFDRARFAGVLGEADASVARVVSDWLSGAEPPSFLASGAVVAPLGTDPDGNDRHHIRLDVHNDSRTAGAARVATRRWSSTRPPATFTDPFVVGPGKSVGVGLVVRGAPRQLWLHTYLSLNREPVLLALTEHDPAEHGGAPSEPVAGVGPSDWRPEAATGVHVDDLDPGFAIEPGGLGTARRASRSFADDLDRGLPPFRRRPGEWFRLAVPTAWGRHRHTLAVLDGEGESRALFAAGIPAPGRWRLDYHMPGETRAGDLLGFGAYLDDRGEYRLTLRADGTERSVAFDGGAAHGGWNEVGVYDLNEGRIVLAVAGAGTDGVVVADAIRWVPVRGRPPTPPAPDGSP